MANYAPHLNHPSQWVRRFVPFPFMGEGLVFTICSLLLPYGYQVTRANRIPPARYIVIGVQRALALVGAQWLARFVRDPEVYITVSFSDLRRGVAQWLARFVRDEEAGGSSPLTPTIFSLYIVTRMTVLTIISPFRKF